MGSAASGFELTLRRYADYAIRHRVKFNDGRGNEIEVGPSIIALLEMADLSVDFHGVDALVGDPKPGRPDHVPPCTCFNSPDKVEPRCPIHGGGVTAFGCRFPGCQGERLPKTIWCDAHRYPAARADGRCLSTGCGHEAEFGSPWCGSHLRGVERSQERDALRATLERAIFVAEHLFQMIDPQAWRDSGGDDSQGHYEGDYRAEQTAVEIERWRAEL